MLSMDLSAKKLTAIFTLAAGMTAGGVIGVGTLYYSHQPEAPHPQESARIAFNSANDNRTAIEAEVIGTENNRIDIRAHTWVGQYTFTSVCERDGTLVVPKCPYVADISDKTGNKISSYKPGQAVYLRNLSDTGLGQQPTILTLKMPTGRPTSDVVPGPVKAKVVRMTDGDTVGVIAEIWPGSYVSINIRIGEIDTPEKGGRAKCPEEAALAKKASAETERLLKDKEVLLYDIQYEKYGGRLLADVRTMEGVSAAQNLIDKKLARPYSGGKKEPWCKIHAAAK
jgi:micrococcal nuclease